MKNPPARAGNPVHSLKRIIAWSVFQMQSENHPLKYAEKIMALLAGVPSHDASLALKFATNLLAYRTNCEAAAVFAVEDEATHVL